jgi:coenzyme F420-reducing hydrogenase alpha subunit
MNDTALASARRIEVPILARVEGEGALYLRLEGDRIAELRLHVYEPPRFFETFLQGRLWTEVPDITARICGICPVAYQMSASQAIEQAFGVTVPPEITALKRFYYCGEWLESHALHIHLLAAPDFLGYPDAISMAKDHPEAVRRGLHLQGLGNAIVKMFGGRAVNPVGVRPGGFYRAPARKEARAMLERLRAALPETEAMVRWVARLPLPEVRREAPWVSLRHPQDYPIEQGRIYASSGLEIDPQDFDQHYREFQVPHSTALHCHLHGAPYWVGPLPRLNNNLDRLPEATRRLVDELGVAWPSKNPYHSALARAIEMHVAVLEAARLLEEYRGPFKPHVEMAPRAGVGAGCTEAPRGILWHRYELDGAGQVLKATIIPPTSQNQSWIEEDLRQSVLESLRMSDHELRLRMESGVRNYDPCISCSTHFLKMTVERL